MKEHEIRQRLQHHLSSPEISATDYFLSLAHPLGLTISEKKKVYLDTRYWVFMRDAAMGRAKLEVHTQLLQKLRDLVKKNIIICPISDASFVETMQQTDAETRRATAETMSELSTGIALASERDRIKIELTHFIENAQEGSIPALGNSVWVRAAFVLGSQIPYDYDIDPKVKLAFEKSAIDHLWSLPLTELEQSSKPLPPTDAFELTAKKINVDKERFAHELKSSQQAFIAEIGGCLSTFKSELASICIEQHKTKTGSELKPTQAELQQFQDKLQGMLVHAFQFAEDRLSKWLPSLYVMAKCHGGTRWNKTQQFNGHWLIDLHHAVAAVGHCHAFFTEKTLRTLLISGHVALHTKFGTQIYSKEEEALQYLESL